MNLYGYLFSFVYEHFKRMYFTVEKSVSIQRSCDNLRVCTGCAGKNCTVMQSLLHAHSNFFDSHIEVNYISTQDILSSFLSKYVCAKFLGFDLHYHNSAVGPPCAKYSLL